MLIRIELDVAENYITSPRAGYMHKYVVIVQTDKITNLKFNSNTQVSVVAFALLGIHRGFCVCFQMLAFEFGLYDCVLSLCLSGSAFKPPG